MSYLRIYDTLEQGSDEWIEARRGLITASTVGKLLTATGKVANSDTARTLANALAAERITGHVESVYVSDAMWRGTRDEPYAREHYSEHHAPVEQIGFMTRTAGMHFMLGYSPDGLVGDDGLIECKSRDPKTHLATILRNQVPAENMAQIQAGMLVAGRAWCDYISWCGGMPMWVIRVTPDHAWRASIIRATIQAEHAIRDRIATYTERTHGLPETERLPDYSEMEMTF